MDFKNTLFVLSIVAILSACTSEKEEVKSIYLKNNLSIARVDEPIILKESFVKKLLVNNEVKNIYFETVDGEKIPFQLDNINGVKEFSLECDFKSNEKKQIIVRTSNNKIEEFKDYTNIRLGKNVDNDGIYQDMKEDVRDPNHLPGAVPVLYQMEGISWENDKVGYRSYWDKRNGKDIWGKITSDMVMDSVGLPNTPSYHELQPWGVDVLKVGNSLGAGALAMIKDGKLFRLGDTNKSTFKIITEGPVRAIIELDYKGWVVEKDTFNLKQIITIWKGKYWYQSDVVIEGENSEDVKLVTGITNIALPERKYTQLEEGDETIVYTFGKQTEQHELMGLALFLNSNKFNKIIEAPNKGNGRTIDGNSPISHTFYTNMKKGNTLSFKFTTGWERSETYFKSAKGFQGYLVSEVDKLNSPIEISIK